MSHIPDVLDIKTDLRRSVMASYSPKAFNDINAKTFLTTAEKKLELTKDKIDTQAYIQAKVRLKKSKNIKSSLIKRREDLLTASCLICIFPVRPA
jgi:hypothetical protein